MVFRDCVQCFASLPYRVATLSRRCQGATICSSLHPAAGWRGGPAAAGLSVDLDPSSLVQWNLIFPGSFQWFCDDGTSHDKPRSAPFQVKALILYYQRTGWPPKNSPQIPMAVIFLILVRINWNSDNSYNFEMLAASYQHFWVLVQLLWIVQLLFEMTAFSSSALRCGFLEVRRVDPKIINVSSSAVLLATKWCSPPDGRAFDWNGRLRRFTSRFSGTVYPSALTFVADQSRWAGSGTRRAGRRATQMSAAKVPVANRCWSVWT